MELDHSVTRFTERNWLPFCLSVYMNDTFLRSRRGVQPAPRRAVRRAQPVHSAPQVAGSAKAVAQACDVTLACLADPEAALEVAAGSDGAAAGLSQGDVPAHFLQQGNDPRQDPGSD